MISIKSLLTALVILFTPPFILSIIVFSYSWEKYDWGSIPDWIGIITTVCFGFYAITQWIKPKIDNDVYEYAKKIVVFDYAKIKKQIEDEYSEVILQFVFFRIIHGLEEFKVDPGISKRRIYDNQKLFEKTLYTEKLQGIIRDVDDDLLIINKLGKEFKSGVKELHEEYRREVLISFLTISNAWRIMLDVMSKDDEVQILNDAKSKEIKDIYKTLMDTRNSTLSKNHEIYNFSNKIMDYFI